MGEMAPVCSGLSRITIMNGIPSQTFTITIEKKFQNGSSSQLGPSIRLEAGA